MIPTAPQQVVRCCVGLMLKLYFALLKGCQSVVLHFSASSPDQLLLLTFVCQSDQWRADENENSNINIVHMDMEWPAGAISKIVPLKGRSGTVTGVRVQCCHAVVEAKDRRGGVLWMSRGTWPELDIGRCR